MKLTFDVPEEMAEKIAEDIKVALEEHKKKQIFPRKDEYYFYVKSDGTTDATNYIGDSIDKKRFEIGNGFKTREEAEFRCEQLKVMYELEQLANDNQEWNDEYAHYHLEYNYNEGAVEINCNYGLKKNPFYFKSKESALAAIINIGVDRLKKYYFCIPKE